MVSKNVNPFLEAVEARNVKKFTLKEKEAINTKVGYSIVIFI